jgi:hypothetical protein
MIQATLGSIKVSMMFCFLRRVISKKGCIWSMRTEKWFCVVWEERKWGH